jgi:cyclase
MRKNPVFQSKHFVLNSLTSRIFAAIAIDGGSAICNSGLIDLGRKILVFDTFLTPQAATDLREIAKNIFGRIPQIIINSHYHNDHIWGNQVFASNAHIISSSQTRALIETEGAEELKWYVSNSAQRLESILAQSPGTDNEKQEQLLWRGEYEGIVEALPLLSVCMPDITFENHLEIHGANGTARLTTFEHSHTKSDTILHLPEEGIIFMSDLLFVGCHPYLADGDPFQLLKTLKDISQFQATQFIPGHGPVGTGTDILLMIEYIELIIEIARTLGEDLDKNEAKIKEMKIPRRFLHWKIPTFWQSNIRFLFERLNSKRGDHQGG